MVIALPEVAERQHKQHDRDDAIERGDRHEAAAVATAKHRTEESDKRNREGGGDEAADVTAEHAERIGVVALDRVGGEIRKNRCDRRLDAGIDSTRCEDVGDEGVPELGGLIRQGRCRERDEHRHRERDREPQEPRAALAPLRACMVDDRTPHDGGDRVGEARDKQDRRRAERTGRGDAEHIGVEVHDVRGEGDIQQIARHIGERVAHHLLEGQFDPAGLLGHLGGRGSIVGNCIAHDCPFSLSSDACEPIRRMHLQCVGRPHAPMHAGLGEMPPRRAGTGANRRYIAFQVRWQI